MWFKIVFFAIIACERPLLFGRVEHVSRERASERRSREGQRKGELATISHKISRVPARLAPLAQIGELARRLSRKWPFSHERGSFVSDGIYIRWIIRVRQIICLNVNTEWF